MKYLLMILFWFIFLLNGQSQNQLPVAVYDTVHIYQLDDTITVNVMQNDFDPEGDLFFIASAQQSLLIHDSTISFLLTYEANHNYSGLGFNRFYVLKDTIHNPDTFRVGRIFFFFHIPFFDSLDINGVSARINNNGNHFWDVQNYSAYFVPKDKRSTSVFNFSLWVGGLDASNQLHLAAERYIDQTSDFNTGPITDSTFIDATYNKFWNRVWKISKIEINYHQTHWWIGGYQVPEAILNWPGNGDTSIGQMSQLAPFHDENNNGTYEPMMGDYPLIQGDQAVYFIFNDTKKPHTYSEGAKVGIEVHGMAYAFDCPEDSALYYTTFLHYDIYNRSSNVYQDTYLGTFVDTDLGYAWDDYVGCDIQRNSFYCYNGRNNDGNILPSQYGTYPPAISATILGGPILDPDNTDNPKTDQFGNPLCDNSINGYNYNDGVIDNERFGMSTFHHLNNAFQDPRSDPVTATEYYNSLKGIWKDSIHMKYGGGGHWQYGSTFLDCNFMFPELSDFCNWGTNGIQPPGYITGAGGNGLSWTQSCNGAIAPDDNRGVISMGPFTFHPGEKQELDVAFVWARQYTDTMATAVIPLLKSRIDQIIYYYLHDSTPCGSSFSGIAPLKNNSKSLRLYPNPAKDQLNIEYDNSNGKAVYSIMGIAGNLVSYGSLDRASLTQLSLGNLNAGMYIIKVVDCNSLITRKFIKR